MNTPNSESIPATSAVAPERPADPADAPLSDVDRNAAAAADAAVAADIAATLAADASADAETAANAAEDAESATSSQPYRARTRTLLLMLVTIALLYTCFLARELIVPILLAAFIALCGNPIVSRLRKWWVPRWIGALVVVTGGLAALLFGASLLLPSAAQWLQQAPRELRQHVPKLRELTKPFEEASKATASLQQMTEVGPPAPAAGTRAAAAAAPVRVMEAPKSNLLTLLSDAPRTIASVLVVLILSFFFMMYGEDLLRRVVTIVPGWRQKRITVDILRSMQADISRYMLTITVINIGMGAATFGALVWIGLPLRDAALWGVVAGVLNFAPYIGPLITAMALLLVGMVQFDNLSHAMLPTAAFLGLHLLEGQFITPLILGKRMAISPVILMLWLFLWGWMWGIAGLLLAVPMLVCFKIYCDRVESMKSWATMMEP